MNKKYFVVSDGGDVYTHKVISSNNLIQEFIDISNETEDADTIGWLKSLIEDGNQQVGVDFIAELWDLNLEEVIG